MTVPGRSRPAATRKEATKVSCRLSGNDVAAFAAAARDLAVPVCPRSTRRSATTSARATPWGPSAGRSRALVIYNDPPYGTERSWNGLRLAHALSRRDGVDVKMFLPADAGGRAAAGQKVPYGYCHLDRMIEGAARHGAEAGCCATCMDARPHDCQRTDPSRWPSAE